MTEIEEVLKSLDKARELVKDLPDPEKNIGDAIDKAEEAVKELCDLKKELDDLENKILHPLNRAQRRASEKKIQKLANKFERKSQERVTSRNVSEK